MQDNEALDEISRILSAAFGSGQWDLHCIAQIVAGTGRQVGRRFQRAAVSGADGEQ